MHVLTDLIAKWGALRQSDPSSAKIRSPPGLPLENAPHRKVSILVAEDNAANQMALKRLIEREGCEVTIVANGSEAVNAVAGDEHHFDLVLMDLNMPIMDGKTAIVNIRKTKSKMDLPVIALTASLSGSGLITHDSGFDDIGTKPLSVPAFRRFVEQYVEPNRLRSAAAKHVNKVGADDDIYTGVIVDTILLAEDDVTSSRMMCRLLERAGYKVEVAMNGAIALQCVQDKRFLCILMDCDMTR